jgi:hypothetical protein
MPRLRSLAALAATLLLAAPALAEEGAPAAPALGAPTGLTGTVSLGGGGELGLDEGEGDAGVLELEAAVGWELSSVGIRPELAAAFGLAPDTHVALRPGVRVFLPGYPIQLRVALDAANARDRDFGWRWLLIGAAAEFRLTSLVGLYGEVDTGAKLSSGAGLPLLVRAGASFRF